MSLYISNLYFLAFELNGSKVFSNSNSSKLLECAVMVTLSKFPFPNHLRSNLPIYEGSVCGVTRIIKAISLFTQVFVCTVDRSSFRLITMLTLHTYIPITASNNYSKGE